MKAKYRIAMIVIFLTLSVSWVWAQFPKNPTFTTVLVQGQNIGGIVVDQMEGLTGDNNGKFYVADRLANTCNVWEINTNTVPAMVTRVGAVNANGCRPSGITFGSDRNLYITSPQTIHKLTPAPSVPSATEFAIGVPGANGVAFDKQGNLLVTDGTENQGRIWKIGPAGGDCSAGSEINCEEFFRIPPRRNGTALGGNVTDQPDGVGSVRFTVPRFDPDDAVADRTDRQDIVANGIALSAGGRHIFIADTARGAIWRAELRGNGSLRSATGCDPTLTTNTLCIDSLYVAHPLLEGVDGIILLRNGTILASVNERNAIVAIASNKNVTDAFQNSADSETLLRNGRTDDPSAPLEFPTSPFASGRRFCTTNADSPRRDNNPNLGEGNGEGQKVNCLDQNLMPPGLPLPVQ